MPLSTATITLDIADILGNDFDSRRTKVWVTTNTDYVVDTDGNQIRLGSGNVTVNADGTAEAEVWIPGTGSNPASWQTTFHVDYPDRNTRGGRAVESFGPFTITASADLADLVEEQAIPPDYAGELVAEMEALRDEAAAITGLTGEDEAVALLVETPSSDTATALANTVGAAIAAAAGPALADLAGFIVIGHRGAANIYPENSIEGYKGALATSLDVIEAGDLYLLADGGVAVMHDATVDRTTSSSGNVSSVTSAGLKRMRLDASAWFGGGWPDLEVPTFDDALTVLGGRALLAFEIKDSGASATTAINQIIAKVNGLGIAHSVVVSSSGLTELGVIIAGGLSGMYNVFTLSGVATPASLEAAGVEFAAIDISLLASGASWIADAQSRGIKVVGFTADHQGRYDACVAAGLDGMYSNDPVYASRDYATYRKTATTWHVNGTWGHGYTPAGSISGAGPWTVSQRGNFYGEAGAYRWRPTKAAFVNAGEVSPVANPTGTYTITAKIVFDSAFTSTSNGACLFVCSATDNPTNTAGNLNSSYLVKVRASGVINAWEITAAGAANSLGTGVTSTAPSFPVLSSGLTSGVAVTSLPVNALTVALKVGHQFILPTGQVATVSGAAAVGATAIPVNSITPSAAVASGSILLQQVTVTIAVTPTNVTIQRSDDPGTALVAANTNQRGGYIQIQNATFGDTGDVSFASLTIS